MNEVQELFETICADEIDTTLAQKSIPGAYVTLKSHMKLGRGNMHEVFYSVVRTGQPLINHTSDLWLATKIYVICADNLAVDPTS